MNTKISQKYPLVVDLDGTIFFGDVLFEKSATLIISNPREIFRFIRYAANGRAYLKEYLSKKIQLEPSRIPFNQDVINLILDARSKGIPVVLATASNQADANMISEYLGIFDEVLASDQTRNLKGRQKALELISRYGEKSFDYVGDSISDLEVWRHSRHAYTVSKNPILKYRISRMAKLHDLSKSKPSYLSTLLKSLRIHQWVKNLLIFVPLLAVHEFYNVGNLLILFLAFLSFSLAASSIYIVNDLADISHDRDHPTKRNRPIASGHMSIPAAIFTSGVLLALSLFFSFLLPLNFLFSLILYLILTTAYTFVLKKFAIIDVVVLATLYTLRIVAGALAISSVPSFWMLTFSMFLFLSLALMKRYSELFQAVNVNSHDKLGGRGYSPKDLEYVSTLGVSSGLISVLVLLLYINDSEISKLYNSPLLLWLSGPLMLIWIARAWVIAHRGSMQDDPVLFAIKDKQSYLLAFLLFGVFVIALVA